MKVLEKDVVCPGCDLRQTYHSHKKKVKGKRRKKCNRCGKSFKVKDNVTKTTPRGKEKLEEERNSHGQFVKYSRSSQDSG